MAKISLRIYNREIDGMIESGQFDEAIAHCQHILKTFPMHVETYRLLGKSLLEARRYTEAADIFQRVLMAVPDDFITQVGMSIIRDDEGKLDDAIWHMERAFESQPSNPAIQGELRRLYGRRDGVEPPKIRLSRDALANMYAQGELFDQAIAEIHSVLAEDANRPDLQVMLARAYYRSGQKDKAAEKAASLVKKYSYCLDALRILVDVLPEITPAEDTQAYRQNLYQLDPYSSFVTGSVFNTDQVPNEAVELERLEYTVSAMQTFPQPSWVSSLGIKLFDDKNVETLPDWMKTNDSYQKSSFVRQDSPRSAGIPDSDSQSNPEGMGSSRKESNSMIQEKTMDANPEKPAEPIPPADIPERLKGMASKEEIDAADAGSIPVAAIPPLPGEKDIPGWLLEHETGAGDAGIEPSQPADIHRKMDAFPDWLTEADETTKGGTTAAIVAETLSQPKTEAPQVPTQVIQPPPSAQVPAESQVPTPGAVGASSLRQTTEGEPLKDDTLAWLESLTAKQDAKDNEFLTKAENGREEMPDWMRPIEEPSAGPFMQEPSLAPSETPPLEPLPSPSSELAAPEATPPAELIPPTPPIEGTPKSLNIEGDMMAWPEGLAAMQGVKEELLSKPETRKEEIPDWLRPAVDRPAPPAIPEQSPELGETRPLEPLSAPAGEMAVPETVPSEVLPTEPENRMEEKHDLLVPAQDQATAPVTPESTSESIREVPLAPLSLQAEEETALETTPLEEISLKMPTADESIQSLKIDAQEPNKESATSDIAAAPEIPQADASFTSWLSKLDAEKKLGKSQPADNVPASEAASLDDLPDWLKNPESPAIPVEAPKPAEDLPDWMRQPAQTGEQGAATVPTQEPTPEPEMPAWIDEEFPVSEQTAPTTPGEWIPVNERTTPVPDIGPIAETSNVIAAEVPVEPQIHEGNEMPARGFSSGEDSGILATAQAALNTNNPNEAMKAYTSLIRKNLLLNEVIRDLREATNRFPMDIKVWMTLGEASMRANHLQDALDAYTKAEDLLQ